MKNKYIEAIEELNELIYKLFPNDSPERMFNYSTDGYVDIIMFGEIHIWNSEDNDAEWIEEDNDYEPFVPYIIKKYTELVGSFHNINSGINDCVHPWEKLAEDHEGSTVCECGEVLSKSAF